MDTIASFSERSAASRVGVSANAVVPSRRPRSWREWVLGTSPGQQANVAITLGGQVGYIANLVLLWYCNFNGLLDSAVAWPITLSVIGLMAFFYLALRLNWRLPVADSSLALPQMMAATLCNAVGYAVTREAHLGLLMPQALSVAFCVFSLCRRDVAVLQTFSIMVFAATSTVMTRLDPARYDPLVEAGAQGMLAAVVVLMTMAGSRVSELRRRDRLQRSELAATLVRIEELASRDALTGLYNRRCITALLAHHVERARRYGEALTLTLIDLDHFKQVNNLYGHAAGDQVLRVFANTIRNAFEGTHMVGRWGGEEFLILSPMDANAAALAIDRLRVALQDLIVTPDHAALRVAFSAGVAALGADGPTQALRRADDALYAAKNAGRGITRKASDFAQ